jgi:hypothetical protein
MMFRPQKAFYSIFLSSLIKLFKVVFLFFILFLIVGCHMRNCAYEQETSFPSTIKNIVVVGFKPALSGEEKPSLFRCPLCGATFMAEPVSVDVSEEMTVFLFNFLEKNQKYTLIPPGQAKGVSSTILSQNLNIGLKDMLQKIGKSFSSDAVLFGHIYRWAERVGADYGVESPASVAFDLHLVSTDTGSVLWKDSFKKRQLSLSENLLDLKTFIKSRGKWLTARELAYIGLESMIKCIGNPTTR